MSISTETKTEPDTAQADTAQTDITERVILEPNITRPDTTQQGWSQPDIATLEIAQPDKAQPLRATRSKFGWRARWGLLVMTAGCIFIAWLALAVHRAHQQRDAVAAILKLGGKSAGVRYDYQRTESGWDLDAPPPGPGWLRNLAGFDSVAHVVEVHNVNSEQAVAYLSILPRFEEFRVDNGSPVSAALLRGLEGMKGLRRLTIANNFGFGDAEAAGLEKLTQLESLDLRVTSISDLGLAHLKALTSLRYLNLSGTRIKGPGLQFIQGLTDMRFLVLSRGDVGPNFYYRAYHCAQYFRGMSELRRLNLHGSYVEDSDLQYLQNLTRLENLDVGCIYGEDGGITDDGLAFIAGLTRLKKLNLDGSAVTGPGLTRLASPSQLRELSLKCTNVTDAGLDSLQGLPAVESLDLNHCRGVGDDVVERLAKLPRLKKLGLCATQVGDSGVERLSKSLPHLKELDLSQCAGNAGLRHLESMSELRSLKLSECGLTSAGLAHLKGLTQLQELDLTDNPHLGNDAIGHLERLVNLRTLNLSHCSLTDGGLAHLRGMVRLEELDLSENRISGPGMENLSGMVKLTGLSVRRQGGPIAPNFLPNFSYPLGNEGLKYLLALPRLKSLDIAGNPSITDRAYESLKQMTQLRQLKLGSTGIADRWVDRLRQTLWGCEIDTKEGTILQWAPNI